MLMMMMMMMMMLLLLVAALDCQNGCVSGYDRRPPSVSQNS